jgi:hypothetical protein
MDLPSLKQEGGLRDLAGQPEFRELVVIRYVGVLLGETKGDESGSFRLASEALGMSVSEVRACWDRRHVVLKAREAEFQISEDYLRSRVRGLYVKLVDELFSRDMAEYSIKAILDAIKTVVQVEAGTVGSRGLAPAAGAEAGNNGVLVTRSNVMIVPMPESAQRATREAAGRVVNADAVHGRVAEDLKRLEAVRGKDDVTPTELDAVEEVIEMERRVLKQINGDDDA